MLLGALLENIAYTGTPDLNAEIRYICSNINDVREDSIFVAIKGQHTNAAEYIPLAIHLGAKAIVCGPDAPIILSDFIVVEQPRQALALLCSNFYGRPSDDLHVIGVTGTNGKTTTSYMIRHILANAGKKTGLIGTIEACGGEDCVGMNNTTPEPWELYGIIKKLRDDGCRYLVMEVSSQGLHQHRTDGIRFDQGVFTNFSAEHLDYHQSMEEYLKAKMLLIPQSRNIIANADCSYFNAFSEMASCQFFSIEKQADYQAVDICCELSESRYTFCIKDQHYPVRLSVPGIFNVANSLAALAVCSHYDIDLQEACRCLACFNGVRGRMELLKTDTPYSIMIDFAHTPEGLRQLLTTARQFIRGRMIVVFGCGGDRDKSKRKQMGKIAGELADYSVITSDNPRTEDPDQIIFQIRDGMPDGARYTAITDRTQAIAHALRYAKKDDCVILAGKGHEEYQLINGIKHHYDEREVVRELLQTNCKI